MAQEHSSSTFIANALGYLVGLGSLMLYTPIAVRLFRQKTAHGTTMITWMMKLSSYTCTDLYSLWKHYPISTYIDTLIITFQAAIILTLVVIYQQRYRDPYLWSFVLAFTLGSAYLYFEAPPEILTMGQLSATALNSGALVPQFVLNFRHKTKGDYSPVTAALAATGCAIRMYTITELADSDGVLLFSFGVAFVLNTALMLQIVYYGMAVEGLSFLAVFAADVVTTSSPASAYAVVRTDSNLLTEEDEESPTATRPVPMSPMEVSQGSQRDDDDDFAFAPSSPRRRQ